MKDILYVSPFSLIGGGEVSILTVIGNLDRNKFRPHLVCYEEGPFVDMARAREIDTTVIKRAGPVSELFVISGLVRRIRQTGAVLVHVNSLDIRAAIAARISGVPYIGHLRVIFPFTWRDRLFVRASRATIAVSNAAVNYFCGTGADCRRKFIVIPNAVDVPAGIKPAPLRTQFGIPGDAPLIGIVGRPDRFKGHDVFIDAAAMINKEMPGARFVVVGAPSAGSAVEKACFEEVRSRAEILGISPSVIFTGFRLDALNVIAALDVIVMPSRIIKRGGGIFAEGFGRVAAESMALGVPVVVSDAGGLGELVRDGTSGIVVPAGDPGATARAVTSLIKDREKARRITEEAKRQFVELYGLKPVARIERLYDDIV